VSTDRVGGNLVDENVGDGGEKRGGGGKVDRGCNRKESGIRRNTGDAGEGIVGDGDGDGGCCRGCGIRGQDTKVTKVCCSSQA